MMQSPEPRLDQPRHGAAFGEAFVRFWKKGLTFTGRASRSEYWLMWLLGTVASLVAYGIGYAAGSSGDRSGVGLVVIGGLVVSLATLVPGLALAVRRLHDANFSGWWLLLGLVPFGSIAVLVMLALESNSRGSRFDLPSANTPASLADLTAAAAPAEQGAAPPETLPTGAAASTATAPSDGDRRLVLAFVGGLVLLLLIVAGVSVAEQSKTGQTASVATSAAVRTQQTVQPRQQAVPAVPVRPAPATDAREAAFRAQVESAPGWQKYSSSLYFKWESGKNACTSFGGGCATVLIEKVTSGTCYGGTVEMTLLSNGTPVGSSSQSIMMLVQGDPLEVGVPFSATLKGDQVRLDRITCS
ncbi:DUF805 domain-containing protein [Sinomonas humi]|uniref:DUF805 domain-containing protein n=1 Tax=Sinomonas humi TaxID=1338436 RepID=UPI0009DE97E6|nr:DUF805 domain-containing protein [Sinomonas humi]